MDCTSPIIMCPVVHYCTEANKARGGIILFYKKQKRVAFLSDRLQMSRQLIPVSPSQELMEEMIRPQDLKTADI